MDTSRRAPKHQTPVPTRCAIYARVSSSLQEDNSSLATQEAACRSYAADHGWEVVAVERDVHTGADLFGRPRLSALRERVRAGDIDIILCYALDRLSRKQTHVAIVAEECEQAGAKLAFVTEDFEEGPVGTFIRSAKAFAAELEREKIKERTRRGVRARAESGKPLPGPRPAYGYRWKDDKKSGLEVHEENAARVRWIYESVLGGSSLRAVTLTLNRDGVPTPAGGAAWSFGTVHKILNNPTYTGTMWAFRWKAERMKGGWISMEERPISERIAMPEGVVPPLVSDAEFEAVKVRLAANRAQSARNNRNPEETLLRGGFARCGYCGGALQAERCRRARGGNGPTYTCGTTNSDRFGCPSFAIAAPILDREVWERVEAVLKHPQVIEAELQRRQQDDHLEADVAGIDGRLEDIQKRQANLSRVVASIDDADAAIPLIAELRNLAAQRRELEADRETIEERRRAMQEDDQRLINIAHWCDRVAANLGELSYTDRRDVLAALGVSAKVWRKDHAPRWEITMDIRELAPLTDGMLQIESPTAGACGTP
jgi:site-specific DNA recombinase